MRPRAALFVVALLLAGVRGAAAEGPPGGTIGYVFTDLFWSVYQTEDASECPQGFNDGPREQFAALYPEPDRLDVQATQLAQEIATWHPTAEPDGFPFYTVEGPYAYGLDLDGETSPDDFEHPDGTPGIDNAVYRAVGCIIGFRGPDGVEYIFQSKAIKDEAYNRMMINLTGVDSLADDDSVTVTVYRGRDELLTDATGEEIMPGGTQRVDRRWGEPLIRETPGRIEDGVLTTEPIDELVIPWQNLQVPSIHRIRDARFELRLDGTSAEGLLAGYADVDTWYFQLIRNDSTHHLANGQISAISLYKALRRLADAYPDPETGENTAISTALDVRMTQVYIVDGASREASP
ncbi:MAG: hypothetical protein ACX93N_03910 [Pseudohaliea sp.]